MHPTLHFIAFATLTALALPCVDGQQPDRHVDPDIQVREGYTLSVAVSTLNKPRFMETGPDGALYVSLPDAGEIKACRDADGDGYYETIKTFVSGHRTAHGMFFHDGWLWFTESTAIFRARDTDGDGRADEQVTIFERGTLPGGSGHWWRPILIHNDRLYTGVGDSGNITASDGKRQKIWTYKLDGSDEKLFCSGIRNTEKLVVRPGTDEVWGMDHGSDWFGRYLEDDAPGDRQPITDRNPPCEMNHYVQGGFYGHPFIVGSRVPRYEYMDRDDIVELAAKTIVPEWPTGAHWAPNAMEFYDHDRFPGCRGDAFVAYHGSWNRSTKAGYCVTRVLFDQGHPFGELKYVDFLAGKDDVVGRPVDCAQLADGSLLISDDHGNRIYRLRYTGGDVAAKSGASPPGDSGTPRSTPRRNGKEGHDQGRVVDLESAPMSLFEQACARCHGPYGSFYGKGFGRKPADELREVVKEMLEGPAGLRPSDTTVDAMVAYHRGLDSPRPFVCVTNGKAWLAGDARVLEGEVAPGASVTLASGGRTVTAKVRGHRWSAQDPPDAPFDINAVQGDKRTTIRFPDQIWSHAVHAGERE